MLLFPNGIKGLADSKWSGAVGSAFRLVGIDLHSKPGVVKVHQKLTKNSSTTIDELCKAAIPVSDGSRLWFSSESGKIWREIAGVYTLIYTTLLSAYSLFTAILEGSKDISADTASLIKISMRPSGAKMFVLEFGGQEVHEYTLSTALDITTATRVDSFSTSTQTTATKGLFVRADGLKMYVIDATDVYQYTLSVAWDVSTSSYDSKTFDVSSQTSVAEEIRFKTDGLKMYVLANEVVYQYTLSVAWDVSTATYDSVSFTESQGGTFSFGFTFNADGTRMYITDAGTSNVYQYSLSTAWDLSTVTYDSVAWAPVTGGATSIDFDGTGANVYIAQVNEGTVYQYSLADGTEEVKTLDAEEHNDYIYWATEFYLLKVAVADIGSAWGSNAEIVGRFVNGDDTYHPMAKNNLSLFIGDGTDIAEVNYLHTYASTTLFNVNSPERITAITPFDIDILVGTLNVNTARVLRWDTVSESWHAEDDVQEKGINAFIRDDNYVYVNAGEFGRLYFYNGEKLEPYQRIPGEWSPTKKAVIHKNAVGFLLGVPIFGLSNSTGDPALEGIYSFGSYSKDYAKILDLSFPISSGEFTGLTIGSIVVDGADVYVAWKSGTDVGVDKLDYTAKYASAYIETVQIISPRDRSRLKTLNEVLADYVSLPANTGIGFSYDKNYAGSYTAMTEKTDTKLAQVRAKESIPEIGALQLRIDFTVSSNNAPEVENFAANFADEK